MLSNLDVDAYPLRAKVPLSTKYGYPMMSYGALDERKISRSFTLPQLNLVDALTPLARGHTKSHLPTLEASKQRKTPTEASSANLRPIKGFSHASLIFSSFLECVSDSAFRGPDCRGKKTLLEVWNFSLAPSRAEKILKRVHREPRSWHSGKMSQQKMRKACYLDPNTGGICSPSPGKHSNRGAEPNRVF
ncbi:uncharacterized protein CLUP02_04410 [Colletotrichum lupini]|uniref:Uncharacterized protein n=1 Tax=Colletotrichum lupini TaxID=145971 RepID=A0A9Q8SK94_9PEZI|nr:uncharacterized protein CLUP02_04410 [Colletotrichum lupini]UQC78931.1 hypothetical protein CLUP02_04410 [Colletotrichum lupini]